MRNSLIIVIHGIAHCSIGLVEQKNSMNKMVTILHIVIVLMRDTGGTKGDLFENQPNMIFNDPVAQAKELNR